MSIQKREFNIKSGPSREELFDSLRLFKERRPLRFALAKRMMISDSKLRVKIRSAEYDFQLNGISVEDGSGEKWIITLYGKVGDTGRATYWKGFYDSTKRKGFIEETS